MEIIAKTSRGVMIDASENEIKEIISAVMGDKPDIIQIGQKIPAIDYATTIRKVKQLNDDSEYKSLLYRVASFNDAFAKLRTAVDSAEAICE